MKSSHYMYTTIRGSPRSELRAYMISIARLMKNIIAPSFNEVFSKDHLSVLGGCGYI